MQGSVRLYQGDSRIVLARMIARGEKVASVVCDPPYGLTSITDRFGKSESKAAKYGKDGAFGRVSKGFMGQTWDGNGIERDVEFWRLVFEVLAPGGYIVAFSSARTYHHMAVAIEAAGFITHPMIGWAYASGMPKPHNPKVEGMEGWRHGGQVRKPALEPIYVGQKPYQGPMAHCIRQTGIGAVNIKDIMPEDGRWPANLITDGSEEVGSLFPASAGQRGPSLTKATPNRRVYYAAGHRPEVMMPRGDGGSAMRFFEQYSYACDRCLDQGWIVAGSGYDNDMYQESCPVCDGWVGSPFDGRPLIYNQKAGREDRNGSEHATVKPIALMTALVKHVTPVGMTVLDPFAGSGTTGSAALAAGVDAILVEAEPTYADDIRRRFWRLNDAGSAYLESVRKRRDADELS